MSQASGKRPGRLVRWFFGMPMFLYKLGVPVTRRWILVTTKGRRSGLPRAVVLDLVGHNPATGRYYIQPGWGRASAWVRNIEAHPFVEVQVGRQRFRARVVDVSGSEGGEWLFAFSNKHPVQSMIVGKLLGLRPPDGSEAQVREWFETFPVFGLDTVNPADESGGPKSA